MEKKKIEIIFMGTSEFAVPILKKLIDNYSVRLVVCSPDKPFGRHQVLEAPPTKKLAELSEISVLQPEKVRNNVDFFNQLKKINAKLIIVAAYGKILPAEIINLPEHGCLNVRPSLLPKYRGAAPIQSALMAGEEETGTSVILMDLGMDSGDLLAQEAVVINEEDDFNSLSQRLAKVSAEMLDDIVLPYIKGELSLTMQNDERATFCQKITEDMGRINWALPARVIKNKIRAIAHKVSVNTIFGEKRLNIIKAEICADCRELNNPQLQVGTVFSCSGHKNSACVKCGREGLRLEVVQLEGRKPMAIRDFLNGQRQFIGTILK